MDKIRNAFLHPRLSGVNVYDVIMIVLIIVAISIAL